MSQIKQLPTHIRVRSRLYRHISAWEQQYRKARQRVGELATVLDISAESADTLKRVMDHTAPGDEKAYERAADRLIQLAAPVEAANKLLRRTVRAFLRANIIDPILADDYFPRITDTLSKAEEGREPIAGSDITDWKGVPGAEGPEEAIYPLEVKTMHWSNVPDTIKVHGKLYKLVEAKAHPALKPYQKVQETFLMAQQALRNFEAKMPTDDLKKRARAINTSIHDTLLRELFKVYSEAANIPVMKVPAQEQ